MVKMAVRPHFQMTVVKIQAHFQNEGDVYQHTIWKHEVRMPCTIMESFGKGHMHLAAQQLKYSQGFLICFFSLFLSFVPMSAVSSWSVIPGTKIMR